MHNTSQDGQARYNRQMALMTWQSGNDHDQCSGNGPWRKCLCERAIHALVPTHYQENGFSITMPPFTPAEVLETDFIYGPFDHDEELFLQTMEVQSGRSVRAQQQSAHPKCYRLFTNHIASHGSATSFNAGPPIRWPVHISSLVTLIIQMPISRG